MPASFFFYDLETSGFDPKSARIMQFAGQRTDMDLQPVGEPINTLIRLTPDVLPDPDAVLVTGITPQATLAEGITEAEFLQRFVSEITMPETTFIGYNSIRFDDEFMRYLHYRNFYDAYEWQWRDGSSRWDLLDVVRMTRALRPEGINWPFASDGSPTNSLAVLTSVNKLDHSNAHDALSDVQATIALAQLIRKQQPKLFQYLFEMRDKKNVAALAESGQPFVYTSGAYPGEFEKTTVVVKLADLPNRQGALVYDLRHDPAPLAKLTVKELKKQMAWRPRGSEEPPFPVKALRYNHCPAIAPLSVLDADSRARLKLDMKLIQKHREALDGLPDFARRVAEVHEAKSAEFSQAALVGDEQAVDGQLYDGFVSDADRKLERKVHETSPEAVSGLRDAFADHRLQALLPLYKARNYPESLTSDERGAWEAFCSRRLLDGGEKSRLAKYFERLRVLAESPRLTGSQQFLLEELQLYGESIMPAEL